MDIREEIKAIQSGKHEEVLSDLEDLFYPENYKLSKEEEKMYNDFSSLLAYSCDKLTTTHHEFFGWIKDHNTVVDLCAKESNSLDDFLLSDKLKALLNKNLLELELLDKALPTKKLKI